MPDQNVFSEAKTSLKFLLNKNSKAIAIKRLKNIDVDVSRIIVEFIILENIINKKLRNNVVEGDVIKWEDLI